MRGNHATDSNSEQEHRKKKEPSFFHVYLRVNIPATSFCIKANSGYVRPESNRESSNRLEKYFPCFPNFPYNTQEFLKRISLIDSQFFTMYSSIMITDADIKKLKNSFKDTFTTKDDLVAMEKRQDKKYSTKDDLKDLRSQLNDDIDGKLKIQKREILTEMDSKFSKQKEAIVKDVGDYIADIIVPMFEKKDEQVARIEKKIGLSPLADWFSPKIPGYSRYYLTRSNFEKICSGKPNICECAK